jgi:hypothetical protein
MEIKMAINITVYDLINFPDNPKTITVDLKKVTPVGSLGDDKYVLSSISSATASGNASIQDSYVDYINVGWSK